jgi:hypothetical protein
MPSFNRPQHISTSTFVPTETEFVGFRSARGQQFQNKIPRKDIFAGIDDEVKRDFKMGTYEVGGSKQHKGKLLRVSFS